MSLSTHTYNAQASETRGTVDENTRIEGQALRFRHQDYSTLGNGSTKRTTNDPMYTVGDGQSLVVCVCVGKHALERAGLSYSGPGGPSSRGGVLYIHPYDYDTL